MSDTAGLDKAKGTLIHCCRREIQDVNIVIKSSNPLITPMHYKLQAITTVSIYTLFVRVYDSKTHQAHKDAEELDHISICHRVKTSHKCVEDGNQC